MEVDRAARIAQAASRLRFDAAVATVFERLEAAGVRALLLKGASIGDWLYSESEPRRHSLDCDLLIAPADAAAAHAVLGSLGYSLHFDDRSMPDWWREHASAWVREVDGVTVDLHHTLQGVDVDDQGAWQVLSRDRAFVTVAGRQVPTLALPARAMNLALHAAHHGAGWARPIIDLERGLGLEDDQLWREAASLAAELQATEAFAAGLRLTQRGTRLAAALRLPPPGSVKAELHASTPPPVALGFEQLASASGIRQRLEIVMRKLVPPPDFIRHWDPRAREGPLALLRAYLRRPVWVLRNAPEGYRAWRGARRSVRRAR